MILIIVIVSIAKVEIERLKENRKITKKGRKDRSRLQKECKTVSVAGLVRYMEKKKSGLPKLRRGFDRKFLPVSLNLTKCKEVLVKYSLLITHAGMPVQI